MIIPDVQAKSGVDFRHLTAAANFIIAKKPTHIICLGDFDDMPSLSLYDKPGSKTTEGQRYTDDVQAVQEAMGLLLNPIKQYNKKRKKDKKKQYKPRMVMLEGNHTKRIDRAIEQNPRHFEGLISKEDLRYKEWGWEVIPFLEIINIDGILYSHYFINTDSAMKNVLSGTVLNRLKSIGSSFTQGHTQGLQVAIRDTPDGRRLRGLVAGSFYSHQESYMGPQGNPHWRGCLLKTNVRDGNYDLQEFELENFIKEWGDK